MDAWDRLELDIENRIDMEIDEERERKELEKILQKEGIEIK